MKTWPALSDALVAEYRADHDRGHFPATVVAPNGSLICTTDYALCGAMTREIVRGL